MAFRAFWRWAKAAAADRRGGIAITAALSMLPICMLVFAAVEFHNYTAQRSNLQRAVDTAALAVARAPTGASEADLRALYIAVLKAHLSLKPDVVTLVEAQPDPVTGEGGQPELTYAGGQVTANATLAISPIIASFFIEGDLMVSRGSVVLRESKGLEVALVLDNTASMQTNNRIGLAKTAAENFVTELQSVSSSTAMSGVVKVGLVPFAGTVNVGASYRGQAWLDPNAQSPIHSEIFSTRMGQPVSANRWTLLSTMQIPWAGCVESRPMPYDIQDTAPNAATPATLFVPHFYPDESDHIPTTIGNAAADYPWFHNRFWTWNNLTPGPGIQPYPPSNQWVRELIPAFAAYDGRPPRRTIGGIWLNDGWQVPAAGWLSPADDRNNVHNSFATAHGGTANGVGHLTPQRAVEKYTLAAVDYEVSKGRFNKASLEQGPNMNCRMPPLTRLTTDLGSVRTAIGNMTALSRNTNVPIGMMWGWHLLSPHGPFSDGLAYNNAGATKVLVLMTDGENMINTNFSLNGAEYSGVGYPSQNRIGTTEPSGMTAALNNRLAALCTNVKAAGVVVYTIRVEVTGPNDLLRNCASDPSKAYDVTQASELDAAFKEIARSVQKLRITS